MAGAILGLLTARTDACAQPGPYHNHLVGERALGLAGAFVAVADDPSAIFHNPAGISALGTGAVSTSLLARAYRERRIAVGLETSFGSGALDHVAIPSLPTFLGAVIKLGDREDDGVRPHTLGFTVFNPKRDEYRFATTVTDANGANVRQLDIIHDDNALWIGLGYAYRLTPALSAGAGVFGVVHGIEHSEFELAGSQGGALVGRRASLDAMHTRLVGRVGLRYVLSPVVQFGLMLQPGAVPLTDAAETTRVRPAETGENPTGFVLAQSEPVSTSYVLPWEIRGGASFRPEVNTLLTLDLWWRTGGREEHHPLADSGNAFVLLPRRAPGGDQLGIASGFEWVIDERVPLRGGLLWISPRGSSLPGTSGQYFEDHASTIGAALSVGIRHGELDLSLGATVLISDGDAMGLARTQGFDDPSYRSTSVTDRSVFMYLAGGRHAVRALALQVRPDLDDD